MKDQQPSLGRIIATIYKCISGPDNAGRNWDEYMSHFLPNALHITVDEQSNGSKSIEIKSVSEYIDYFIMAIGDKPFYENEVSRRIEFVDSFAIVWSEYEVRTEQNSYPIYKGANCFQLFFDGVRWQIFSVLWERRVRPRELANSHQ